MLTQEQQERLDWLIALRNTCVAKGQSLSNKKAHELNKLLLIKLKSLENGEQEVVERDSWITKLTGGGGI